MGDFSSAKNSAVGCIIFHNFLKRAHSQICMMPIKELGYLGSNKTSDFIELLEKNGFSVEVKGHIQVVAPSSLHPKSRDCMHPYTRKYLEERDGPSIYLPVGHIEIPPHETRGSLVCLVNTSLEDSPGYRYLSEYRVKIQNIFQQVVEQASNPGASINHKLLTTNQLK